MALDFSGKQKQEDKFREELRVLATHIETINQQLSSGGSGGGPAMGKAFSDTNAKLQYLYEFMKSLQTELKTESKSSIEQVGKQVETTLKKQLSDLYDNQQNLQKSVQAVEEHIQKTPAFNTDVLDDMRKTLSQLVGIYRDEVAVFRRQNEFLQKKLLDIEKKLDRK